MFNFIIFQIVMADLGSLPSVGEENVSTGEDSGEAAERETDVQSLAHTVVE